MDLIMLVGMSPFIMVIVLMIGKFSAEVFEEACQRQSIWHKWYDNFILGPNMSILRLNVKGKSRQSMRIWDGIYWWLWRKEKEFITKTAIVLWPIYLIINLLAWLIYGLKLTWEGAIIFYRITY